MDAGGAVVGEHDGAYAYTVGQRRGLRLGRPAADGRPRYVLAVTPVTNTVVVGPAEALDVAALAGSEVVWLAPDVPAREWTAAEVQVRAHGVPVRAEVRVVAGDADADGGARLEVRLGEHLRGVAAGQSVVVYAGTRVLGQATIERAVRRVGGLS